MPNAPGVVDIGLEGKMLAAAFAGAAVASLTGSAAPASPPGFYCHCCRGLLRSSAAAIKPYLVWRSTCRRRHTEPCFGLVRPTRAAAALARRGTLRANQAAARPTSE